MNIRRLSAVVGLCGIAAIVYLFSSRGRAPETSFLTQEIVRGDLAVTIQATGTVEPEEVVDVGAQVAGLVVRFGVDVDGRPIDYGSRVAAGTVLAEIDQSLYRSDLEQAEAQLLRAKADLQQLSARLELAELNWNRAQRLGPSEALSQSQYDSYRAEFAVAKASVGIGQAQIVQADALLARARRNVEFCIIRSPVDGVIIDRRVNIGQTVVANLNAPSLFLIARDLKRVQVWVSVNESDIGSIQPKQRVRFSVDTFPGEEFFGEVRKIRLNASMTQNVVTYLVEVSAENESGRLLPYLTAKTFFEIAERKDVLLVPSAALRYQPSSEVKEEFSIGNRDEEFADRASGAKPSRAALWVLENSKPRQIPVELGLSDGVRTEVTVGEIDVGTRVIVGERKKNADEKNSRTSNPFAPSFSRGTARSSAQDGSSRRP